MKDKIPQRLTFNWMTITGSPFLQCALKESIIYSFDFIKLIDTSNRRTDSGDDATVSQGRDCKVHVGEKFSVTFLVKRNTCHGP